MADYGSFVPQSPSFAALAGLSPEEEAALAQAARGDPNTGKQYGLGGFEIAGHQRQMEALSNYMGMLSGTNAQRLALANRSMRSNEKVAQLGAQGRAASALGNAGLLNDIGGEGNLLPDMTPDDAGVQRTLAVRASGAKNVSALGSGTHNLAAAGYYPDTQQLSDALDLGLTKGTPLAVMTAAQRARSGGGGKTNYTTIQEADPNNPSRVITRRVYDGTNSSGPVYGGDTLAPPAAGHQQAQTNENGLPGDISGLDDAQYSQAVEAAKVIKQKGGKLDDVQLDSNGDAHMIYRKPDGTQLEYVIPKDVPDAGTATGEDQPVPEE